MCVHNIQKNSDVQGKVSTDTEDSLVDVLLNDCNYVDLDSIRNTFDDSKNVKYFNIMQWNTRSLMANHTNLKNMLTILGDSNINFGAIICNETHLNNIKESQIQLHGYNYIGNNRQTKKGGGVGIYVQDKFDCKERKDLEIFLEGRFESCVVETHHGGKPLLIVSIYKPPSSNTVEFLNLYNDFVRNLNNACSCVIIGGDFNIDLLKSEHEKYAREFMDVNMTNCLIPTITKPTRVTKSSATLIDNIFISKNLDVLSHNSCIITEDSSDHFPCVLSLAMLNNEKRREPLYVEYRQINDTVYSNITENLNQNSWSFLEKKNSEDSFNIFHETLVSIYDHCAPVKMLKVSRKKVIRDPWITKGIRLSSIALSKMYRKSIKTKKIPPVGDYQAKRCLLNRLKRIAKQSFFRERFTKFHGNSRKVWNLINMMLGKKNDKSSFVEHIKIGDTDIDNPKRISEIFADHFSKIGSELSKHIVYNNSLPDLDPPPNKNSIFMKPVTEQDVLNVIDSLKSKRSSGLDNLSNEFLKEVKFGIAKPLMVCINKSICEGVFPSKLKCAIVTPLHKGKERYLVNNYRPISLLLTLSKIFEKNIHAEITNFLEYNDIFFDAQFGFRSGHSTTHAAQFLTAEILKAKEKKYHTGTVYIDLSKAFDTICHKTLLQKLDRMGIRGTAKRLVEHYLKDRYIQVKIGNLDNLSQQRELTTGCPQGSILGPLFFSCLLNEMHRYLSNCKCLCYADDTTIYYSHPNLSTIKQNLEEDLKILILWFQNISYQ